MPQWGLNWSGTTDSKRVHQLGRLSPLPGGVPHEDAILAIKERLKPRRLGSSLSNEDPGAADGRWGVATPRSGLFAAPIAIVN